MVKQREICLERKHDGFTLIELLIVVAIIALLASILFPVFAQAREKARQAVCQSNLKQFMGAILMYAEDYDEKMPLAISHSGEIGPATAAADGVPEFGIQVELMPYAKGREIFHCPDDSGFVPGTTNMCGNYVCAGATLAQALGSSYRFAPENFSQFPDSGDGAVNSPLTPYNFPATQDYKIVESDGLLGPPGGPYTYNPPFPLPLSYFQRPTETRTIRCFEATFDLGADDARPNVRVLHPDGVMTAFMDGHVKWVKSPAQLNSYCDGPTWSPVRNLPITDPNFKAGGDGTCSNGMERAEQ